MSVQLLARAANCTPYRQAALTAVITCRQTDVQCIHSCAVLSKSCADSCHVGKLLNSQLHCPVDKLRRQLSSHVSKLVYLQLRCPIDQLRRQLASHVGKLMYHSFAAVSASCADIRHQMSASCCTINSCAALSRSCVPRQLSSHVGKLLYTQLCCLVNKLPN